MPFDLDQLVGRWVSPAPEALANPDGSTIYGVRDFALERDRWQIVFTAYADEQGSVRLFSLRADGPWSLLGESGEVPGAREADFHFERRLVTAHVPPIADLFASAAAGNGTWHPGEEQDVSSTGAAFIPSVIAAPVEYDLVRLDGDSLFFGDRGGDLSRHRPKALIVHPVERR